MLEAMGEGVVESFDPELKRAFDVADNEVPAHLKDPEKLRFKDGHMKLSGDGIFYTLQGEGPTMGEPATFVRTHICNLRCGWCDAYYTWNPKSEEFWTEPKDVAIPELAKQIEASWTPDDKEVQKRLVLTGGEPLIQQDKVVELMGELGDDWELEIETNGTIMPSDELMALEPQFNCSPKLANSQNSRPARIKPDVIKRLSEGNTTFKFVVMEPEEIDEIETDFVQAMDIPTRQVILMPQGVTAEEVHLNAMKVVEHAKERGFRMLGRLQNEIWGAKRGV
jgi:organic radical activating enzyme